MADRVPVSPPMRRGHPRRSMKMRPVQCSRRRRRLQRRCRQSRPSFRRPPQVLDHWAGSVGSVRQGAIAPLEVFIKRPAEFLQLVQTDVEIGKLALEQRSDLATLVGAMTMIETKQLTNLGEGEAMELRLLDKAQTFEDLHRVNAKSTGRAWSSRDDAELFVVAQRIRRQSTARGEFSDRE